MSIFLSLVFSISLFAFANAQTNTIQVKSNNFLDDYIKKTNPYTYHALPGGSNSTTTVNVFPQNATNTNAAVCVHSATKFNKYGDYGVEVAKLQNFLNEVNGAKLNGKGYFGPATLQEVKNFQYTYGIKPTGYQHIKTTQKINDILCGKVAKVARKVFVEKPIYTSTNVKAMPATTAKVTLPKESVKETVVNKIPTMVGNPNSGIGAKATTTATTTETSTTTSFWSNLQKDFDKIKENYKAYLLVFALVLALFWFLRKAATE